MSAPIDLQQAIQDRLSDVVSEDRHVAVAIRDLERRRLLNIEASRRFPSASVIKVTILIELLARCEEGDFSLSQQIAYDPNDRVEGSGVLQSMHAGVSLTLEDLALLMIVVSDNTASNMLIGLLGCDRINQRLVGLGLTLTRLERKFYDFEARAQGKDNWLAAGEMADLLAAVEMRRVVSPAVCEKTLEIMHKQQFVSKIPALLPPDTRVANKTGSISTASHDAGIIYAPSGPIALCVLTEGLSAPAAEGVIRDIARLTYDFWGTPARKT